MKKIFGLLFIFAFIFAINFAPQGAFAEDSAKNYIVTANYAYIYTIPDFTSEKLLKIENKAVVTLEFENDSVKEYENNGFIFYKVLNFDDVSGYVYCNYVAPENNFVQAIPHFNAKTNSKCQFFVKENNKLKEKFLLEKKHQLFLYEGYHKKEPLCAAAVEVDGEVYYGYVETRYVNPKGVNPVLITCITISIAAIGIVFAWVFIKKKKK